MKGTKLIVFILVSSVLFTILTPFVDNYSFIDELLVLILLFYSLLNYRRFVKFKEIKLYLLIIFFYLIYSLIYAVNIPVAVLRDFFIFLKPFVCFYSSYIIGGNIDSRIKKNLKKLLCILGIYLWTITPFLEQIYPLNTTFYYPACAYTGFTYLFLSDFKKKDWILATLFLLPGILSMRAKFFGELIIWFYVAFLLKGRIKFNIKYLTTFVLLACCIFYINRDKILIYTTEGIDEGYARTVMYIRSIDVLSDYFPFGPGYGTFGSDSASKFYSPLNHKYGLDYIYGLSEKDIESGLNFYSDTFYPILAQFGIFGIFLFIWFMFRLWNRGKTLINNNYYKLFVFVFFYLLIQCIAENTFTGPFGLPIMIMLGLLLSPTNFRKCNISDSK